MTVKKEMNDLIYLKQIGDCEASMSILKYQNDFACIIDDEKIIENLVAIESGIKHMVKKIAIDYGISMIDATQIVIDFWDDREKLMKLIGFDTNKGKKRNIVLSLLRLK